MPETASRKKPNSLKILADELSQDLKSARLFPGFASGLVVGVVEVILAISFGALIYSGRLSGFVANGIGFALIGAIVTGIIVALMTSLPGTVSGNQDVPTAILAVMSAAIVAAIPENTNDLEVFVTVAVTIALTTIICGLFFLGLGYFNLGGLVRFLPYSVVGGFLAGTGWLLVTGSISMMTGFVPQIFGLSTLFQMEVLFQWLPGLVFAVLLMVVLNRFNHFLLLPGLVLGAIAIFFLTSLLLGYSIVEISALGWLLGPFTEGNLFQPLSLSALSNIDWSLVFVQAGTMVIVLVISAISLLLNASGLEIEAEADMDFNHELRAAGTGNVFAGLFSGLIGFQQLSLSALNMKFSARTRLTGLFAAGVCLLALLAGTNFISLFPKFILGGLLMFLGLTFLYEWVFKTWFKLPKADYFIIILILVVIATVGFLEGVTVGILAAVILFAINYSQVDVIQHSTHRSHIPEYYRQTKNA